MPVPHGIPTPAGVCISDTGATAMAVPGHGPQPTSDAASCDAASWHGSYSRDAATADDAATAVDATAPLDAASCRGDARVWVAWVDASCPWR